MATLMLKPLVSDYLDVVTGGGELEFRVEELEFDGECCAIGRSIGDMEVRRKTGRPSWPCGARPRVSSRPTPRRTSHLMTGDRVIAIGTPDQIIKLEELIVTSAGATELASDRRGSGIVITELVQRVVDGWAEEQGWAEVPAVRAGAPRGGGPRRLRDAALHAVGQARPRRPPSAGRGAAHPPARRPRRRPAGGAHRRGRAGLPQLHPERSRLLRGHGGMLAAGRRHRPGRTARASLGSTWSS